MFDDPTNSAAAVQNAPAPTPDLSGLNPPGQMPPNLSGLDIPPSSPPVGMRGSPTMRNMPAPASPRVAAADPNAPHAGLVNILQNMFLGMDAFARAAATGGREGG